MRQNSILSGATILMLTVLASKLLGLVRDRLLAYSFSPDDTAIFLASFRLPDLLFQLVVFGALSVAFIPVFTDFIHRKGEKEAFEFASDTFNVFFSAFMVLAIIIFFTAVPLMNLIVPGFNQSQKDLTAHLTQIILLGQVLLCIGSFFAGVAQSYQRFIIPAFAGVFYNLGVILGIIFLTPFWGIYGPAFGVVVGAALHVLIQLPLVSSLGFRHRWSFEWRNPGVIEIIKLMSMRTIGLAVEQINETVGIILASLVSTASVTYLTFAQHLQTVPIGLFGATMAQAALPVLSREQARGETESFKLTLLTTMHQIFFLTLPVAAILIVLRIPVVRLVFGASQFDWEATVLTGRTMAFLAIGLVGQSAAMLLVRAFYALKDTRTPVISSIVTVLLNIGLSVLFISHFHWDVWGLGVAYAVSSNVSLVILLYSLHRKLGGFGPGRLVTPAFRMLLAAVICALALYIPIKALDQFIFDTTKTINLLALTTIASLFGLSIYIGMVWLMKVEELYTFSNLVKRIYHMQFKMKSEEIVPENTPV